MGGLEDENKNIKSQKTGQYMSPMMQIQLSLENLDNILYHLFPNGQRGEKRQQYLLSSRNVQALGVR